MKIIIHIYYDLCIKLNIFRIVKEKKSLPKYIKMKYLWILLFTCATLSTARSQHQEIFIQIEISLVYGLLFSDTNSARGEMLASPVVEQILPDESLAANHIGSDASSVVKLAHQPTWLKASSNGAGLFSNTFAETTDSWRFQSYILGEKKMIPKWILPAENAWTGGITQEFLLPSLAEIKISF